MLTGSLLLIVWIGVSHDPGFFSGDSGVKFAQSVALWESGFSERSLPYDNELDPHHSFTPYGPFLRPVDGELQGIYSVFFTGAAAPFIGAFGSHGRLVLPILGIFLILVGSYTLIRRLDGPWYLAGIAAACTVAASPVAFYGVQFTEHPLATGLIVCAFALSTKSSRHGETVLAGILAGFAATIRPEAYCGLVSLALALIVSSENRKHLLSRCLLFTGAASAVILTYWSLNLALSETWDPLVDRNQHNSSSWANAKLMLFGDTYLGRPIQALAPLMSAAIAALALPALRRRLLGLVVRLAFTLWVTYVAWRAFDDHSGRTLAGLFSASPFLIVGVLAGPYSSRSGVIWMVAISLGIQTIAFDSSGTGGGLQYGARLLMPSMVLLALAAFLNTWEWCAAQKNRMRQLLALLPLLITFPLSVAVHVRAQPQAEKIAAQASAVTAAINGLDAQVIVTRRWWESQVLALTLLDGHRFYETRGDPAPLLRRLAETGVQRIIYISRGTTDVQLTDKFRARSIEHRPGWLDVQLVLLERTDYSK